MLFCLLSQRAKEGVKLWQCRVGTWGESSGHDSWTSAG